LNIMTDWLARASPWETAPEDCAWVRQN
jgi:hypothetical protein